MKKITEKIDYKIEFLKKSVLRRKTDLKDEEQVLQACCYLAYADMLTAGKYYLYDKNSKNKGLRDTIVNAFLSLLKKGNYEFNRGMIEEMSVYFGTNEKIKKEKKTKNKSFVDYATRFGLSQKFVNMSFKYFYVFSDNLKNIAFNFVNCDCPLDSVILKTLSMKTKTVWSKINLKTYEKIQALIDKEISLIEIDDSLNNIGRLAYDFLNW